ncbi:PAS domain S-box protein [Maribacter sp. X9]|uniref:PAS domain S-box protein n=1 Tax=Maribacter sp. X9 TaxID=3402159 RepID=UPI003AF3CBE8
MISNKIGNIERLRLLKSYNLMDSPPQKLYDDISKYSAIICKTPISLITLLDDKKQFLLSQHGITIPELQIEDSFCKYIIEEELDVLAVENTKDDKRFKKNVLVQNEPFVLFYTGVPLITSDGFYLGALCVMDTKPRKLTDSQLKILKTLAQQLIQLFELRKSRKIQEVKREEITNKSALLKNVINSSRIGTWEWNINTDSLKLNESAKKIICANSEYPSKLNRNDWESHIHPVDLPIVLKIQHDYFNHAIELYDIEYRINTDGGKLIWVHERGKIIDWNIDGSKIIMLGTITDITKKVNYDIELERLKNNQEALINGTNDLLWSITPNYKLIIANATFKKLMKKYLGFNIQQGDLVLAEKFGEADNREWKSYYDKALKGESFSVKKELNRLSPTITYGIISFNPIYDDAKKIVGAACYSKDITSEVMSQRAIVSAKEEMEKIMNASLDIICTIDREGKFLSVSKACEKIWGYKSKDLIGKNYIEFVYEKDRAKTLKTAESIVAGIKKNNFENRYLHKNGNSVPILWSANWDNDEKVMYCVARDITERKKAELRLKQSERRFKTLVQEGNELISILDKDAFYKYVSPTSIKMLQIKPDEFIGKKAFDFIHPQDRETVRNQFEKIFSQPQITIQPFRFKDNDGNWKWMETIATNQMKEPSINGIVTNCRDITDRILHLKAIEEQNKKLKEIAWHQSHIVRAPVARLMGLVELLKDEVTTNNPKTEKILDYILKSTEEIDNVIQNTVENAIPKDKITKNL